MKHQLIKEWKDEAALAKVFLWLWVILAFIWLAGYDYDLIKTMTVTGFTYWHVAKRLANQGLKQAQLLEG